MMTKDIPGRRAAVRTPVAEWGLCWVQASENLVTVRWLDGNKVKTETLVRGAGVVIQYLN